MLQPQVLDDDEPEISIGSGVDASDGPLVGERFGKYLIVGEVAVGGMAELFLGVHRGLEGFTKVVVLKRVLPQFNTNADFVRMFVDEARLAARLEHPNIVRTYEFGEVDGQYFTTMEYLPGEDLGKTLNKLVTSSRRMPAHLAAGIVSQVCAGLHFAHQLTDPAGRPLGLVHRDVNPSNVIITYSGEVKLIDFGVAKTNTNAQTVAGTIKGKLAYMSPEQLLARGVDQRSDVFSAGVVLWELLTQRPLFMRDSEAATLYAIMNDPIAPPSRYRPDLPYDLEAIAMRALARTPADRFDTAEDMSDALDDFLARQSAKCDGRALARMLEDTFGATRGRAKRSIAQTRSLSANISLVMKLRTEVRGDLVDDLDSLAHDPAPAEPAAPRRPRTIFAVLAGAAALALAGVLVYLLLPRSEAPRPAAVAHASLELTSTPPGAAISIGGEPTGLTTPATLTGLAPGRLAVRLELAHHTTVAHEVDIPEGAAVQRSFALRPRAATLAFAQLPEVAVVYVDGERRDGAVTLAPGPHEVRIEIAGRAVLQQQLDVGAGEQTWVYTNDKLVQK
ncbi:MAG: serine/threonine protein kinase [Deltaproteobacteria bacterium]|nr:serine/threonine protein kinase [Deltaproteobacteria bacterium]